MSNSIFLKNMNTLNEYLNPYNVNLSEEQLELFTDYYNLLIETNKVMNLTAITDLDEVIIKHFLDSLSIVTVNEIDFSKIGSIIDLGTGAGFPGIPLKILFPEINVLMLDSTNKKINFINGCIDKLSLKNATGIHARAEELAHDSVYRETFDLCVSRAVARLNTLNEYCLPFVKPGGFFVSYKAASIKDEVKESEKGIKELGGKLIATPVFNLPNSDPRGFAVIEKIQKTPEKYPRQKGLPKSKPL